MSDPDSLIEGVDEQADAELEGMQRAIAELVEGVHRECRRIRTRQLVIDTNLGALHDVRDQVTVGDYAGLLAELRDVRKALAASEALVESLTARAMTDRRMDVPGWQLVRRGGSRWVFRETRPILAKLVDRVMADSGGEVTAESLWTLVDYVEQVCRPSWRTGPAGLPAVGIDPADFGSREDSRRTVELIPVTAEDPEL